MKRALVIASVASMLDNFNRSNIDILLGLGYGVTVAANFHTKEDINSQDKIDGFCRDMKAKNVRVVHIDFSRKVGSIRRQLKSICQARKLLGRRFDLIHCHSPICSVIVRSLAQKYRKENGTRVIYTAHGFHFFTGAPLKNWLVFYPIEKWMSRFTDVLITINKEDYRRAKKKFHAVKTVYIPGVGVDTEKFNSGLVDSEEKRKQFGIAPDTIFLFTVEELIPQKNHEVVIKALAEFRDRNFIYLIIGKGEIENKLKSFVHRLALDHKVLFSGISTDLSEVCQAADLFIYPSHQEKVSLALMEAIACETPVVCSNIRGNTDLVGNNQCIFDVASVDDVVRVLTPLMNISRNRIKFLMYESVKNNINALRKYNLDVLEDQMKSEFGRYRRLLAFIARIRLEDEIGAKPGEKIILSVGELNENKNHRIVVEALGMMGAKERSNFHYCIAGKGEQKDKLMKIAEERNVNLYLLGFRDDIPDILKGADIFILPSIREGLNVSLMEAMASGLPCIASNIRGNRDFAIYGFLYFFEVNSIKSLKKAIEDALKDISVIKSISFMDEFSDGRILNIMRQTYAEI